MLRVLRFWPLKKPTKRESADLLLLGCCLLSSFLGSRLLGSLLSCRLLGSFLGCRLLCRLLWLLHFLWLLGLGLLGLLCLGLLGWKLEGSGTFLASSSGSNNFLGSNHLLKSNTNGSLGGINFVVGHNVLEDSLAGRALLVTKTLDGSCDHGGICWVGSRGLGLGSLLGFWSSSVSHVEI